MSSDRYLLERIPWYLNGTLDDEETAEVERLLAESPEGRAELAEARAAASIYGHRLPSEVLVTYALEGKHPRIPSELIERYLAVSPVAAGELALVQESLAALEGGAEGAPEPLQFQPRIAATTGRSWQRLALAASILGVVGLGLAGWQWTELESRERRLAQVEQELRDALAKESTATEAGAEISRIEALEEANQELAAGKSDLVEQLEQRERELEALGEQVADLSQPRLNVPVLDVFPGDRILRGETEADRRVLVPRQTRTVTLVLISGIEADQDVTGLRIVDADGKRRWSSSNRPERDELGTFTVSLPVESLGVGIFTLQLVEEHDGQTQIVETYQVEIR